MIPVVGQRVRIARDLLAERFGRVPPRTGHCGTVDEVKPGPLGGGRALVRLDLYGRISWFAYEELEGIA